MIEIHKLYLALRKESLILIFVTLIMALLFWYQISPFTFQEYTSICSAIYRHSDEYDRCMNPYWLQYAIGKIELIISLGLAGIFMVIFIINQLSRKWR